MKNHHVVCLFLMLKVKFVVEIITEGYPGIFCSAAYRQEFFCVKDKSFEYPFNISNKVQL